MAKMAEITPQVDEKQVMVWLDQSRDALIAGLSGEIENMLQRYPSFCERTGKGKLHLIAISFLRTGVLDHSTYYRIDCYDEQGFGDLQEYAGTWDISALSDHIYTICAKPQEAMPKVDLRWEVGYEEHWIHTAELVHSLLGNEMLELAGRVFDPLVDALPDVEVYFGEYLDQLRPVWCWRWK